MAEARGKRRAYVFLKTLVGDEEDRIRALAHIASAEGAYPGSSVGLRYHGGGSGGGMAPGLAQSYGAQYSANGTLINMAM